MRKTARVFLDLQTSPAPGGISHSGSGNRILVNALVEEELAAGMSWWQSGSPRQRDCPVLHRNLRLPTAHCLCNLNLGGRSCFDMILLPVGWGQASTKRYFNSWVRFGCPGRSKFCKGQDMTWCLLLPLEDNNQIRNGIVPDRSPIFLHVSCLNGRSLLKD